MNAAIIIPARFASKRYPGKPLIPLRGVTGIAKPLIQRSWEAAMAVRWISRVVVATDDERIAKTARSFGADVVMTPESCANGTERCAAALGALGPDIDVIVNLQGDAPLTPPFCVESILTAMVNEDVVVATPALRTLPETRRRLLADQAAGRVGGTTVAVDRRGDALYFSKSVIPHVPARALDDPDLPVFLHIGVYAYRRDALLRYAATSSCPLEELEGLEQLRFLDMREPVRVVSVTSAHDIWELNNPEDLPVIEAGLASRSVA
ncbi:3-deoxy-manno-octulosonate cytidylyltransferase (CMP-KDO synthetase) [Sphingomonas vulcanisoli]|uniref:3-deoxy-manno-octulosonate cytidylyltransferase (CMP-KDO synthetase) n=1 Tax=Sphingomonas vulcanisoli TaxID=1658060 RepID=A0ABX0TVC8_9SPHN|nr:manno-octulosonate cytidylyltransferase [Sphingomonas vulcanisoli]NIJ09467.1 3-deoxy-manno-octulosonate cytidylyltransferase (CMP-KDO synthetase) [Sphingomonas vulcanisoli]